MPRGLMPEQRGALLADCRAVAEAMGGACLSTEYINAKTKMRWRCENGHEWEATPHNVRHATWCPHCYAERRGSVPGRYPACSENGILGYTNEQIEAMASGGSNG
jgi:hypothetical protein